MRNEDHLRSALRLLERETPDAEAVLRRVNQLPAAHGSGSHSRAAGMPGGRFLTGVIAAAAVGAVAVAALIVSDLPGPRAPAPATSALHRVPPYYLALGPDHGIPLRKGVDRVTRDALIKSTLTGKTLAIIRAPARDIIFMQVSAAADDRTFVLAALAASGSSPYAYSRLYVVKFDPADRTATLTRVNVPAVRVGPNAGGTADTLISPDGSKIAIATNSASFVQIEVYSLANGTVRTWEDTAPPVSYPLTGLGDSNLLTWARDGLLAFNWSYATSKSPVIPVLPQGMRLLNTNLSGGSLLADSTPFCLPEENGGADYGQYLTANGRQIIVPVNVPVKIGRRPARCASAAAGNVRGRPAIEEFSVRTGRATAILGQFSWGDPQTLTEQETLYWSSLSGRVLVVRGPAGSGPNAGQTLGVLEHGRFTPLPRARQVGYTAVGF